MALGFTDLGFLIGFLPCTLAAFYVCGLRSPRWAAGALTVASIVFCACAGLPAAIILVVSTLANYAVARWMLRMPAGAGRRALLWLGVSANLGLLAYFKYRGFFVENANALFGTRWSVGETLLPLGISFVTLQKVAFLVDVSRGKVREFGLEAFVLYSLFFPSVSSGPITRANEMLAQFSELKVRFDPNGFSAGVGMFVVGLAKKLLIADQMGTWADVAFRTYGDGGRLSAEQTWICVLAYSMQIYYDFSAYSEMALGLAKMVNLKLPVNFNAPYKANSIIGFWARWHISLSRFLRDYIFMSIADIYHTGKRFFALIVTKKSLRLRRGRRAAAGIERSCTGPFEGPPTIKPPALPENTYFAGKLALTTPRPA